MENILQSASFKRSAILSRFLRFVVEKTLDGHANHIKEYTVGTMVLGKPHGFNPQTDASVRIHAIRLRKLVEEYYGAFPKSSGIRIHLPKGSYCPVFTEPDLTAPISKEPLYPANRPLATPIPDDSLCVVPFNHFTSHPLTNFSPDGFCGYLSQKLSLFQDITVKSYFSVNNYLQNGGTPEGIGEALNVTYYLSGNIEVNENRVETSVMLFEARSNELIWSQHFSGTGHENSLSGIIDDIGNQIAASLGGYSGVMHYKKVLATENAAALSNSQAIAVFWFYHYLTRQNSATFKEAVLHLEKAVREYPDAALCWAVLAMLYTDSIFFNYATNLQNPLERAQDCVAKALAINPNCQHGMITDGWIHVFLKNKIRAVESFEKTFSINPNASYFTAACSLGMALVGEYERSMVFYEKAIPQHPMPLWWLTLPPIFIALKNNEYEKVLFYARKQGTPAGIQEHIFEMIALYYLGKMETLRNVLDTYLKKYQGGISTAKTAWSHIIFDEALLEKMNAALAEIETL